jgi:U3 small nucleolar RNA-associated protein 13
LERSTFLLDYTLTGMSVVEPEIDQTDSVENDIKLSSGVEDQLPEAAAALPKGEQEYEELKEKSSLKKRKSRKSRDVAYKKVKGLNDISDASIPSQA